MFSFRAPYLYGDPGSAFVDSVAYVSRRALCAKDFRSAGDRLRYTETAKSVTSPDTMGLFGSMGKARSHHCVVSI